MNKKTKIKYEDFKKLAEYLEKNCKGSYIHIDQQLTKVIFQSSTISQQNVEITVFDTESYFLPKIKTEDDL